MSTRTVVKGEPLYDGPNKTGWYAITFSDGLVAETQDAEVYRKLGAASQAKADVDVTTERRASGQTVIVECTVIAPRPESPVVPAAPTAPLTPAPAVGTLTRIEPIPTETIRDARVFAGNIERLRRDYNVITPEVAVTHVPAHVGISFVKVVINPVVDKLGNGREVYHSSKIHRENERSLGKVALLKLAQAINIRWNQITPLPPFDRQYIWGWLYAGDYLSPDGSEGQAIGTKRLDLSDGSSTAAGMSAAQLQQARTFGNEACETKALERAIRFALQLPHKVTIEELARPFVVPRATLIYDTSNPDVQRMIAEKALAGRTTLYGVPKLPLPPAAPMLPPPSERDDEPFAVPDSSERAPESTTSAATTPAVQWPDGARFIADVKALDTGENKSGKWTLWQVVAEGGEIWTTFKDPPAHVCQQAKAVKRPVMVELVPNSNPKYADQLVLQAARICDPAEAPLPFGEKDRY